MPRERLRAPTYLPPQAAQSTRSLRACRIDGCPLLGVFGPHDNRICPVHDGLAITGWADATAGILQHARAWDLALALGSEGAGMPVLDETFAWLREHGYRDFVTAWHASEGPKFKRSLGAALHGYLLRIVRGIEDRPPLPRLADVLRQEAA